MPSVIKLNTKNLGEILRSDAVLAELTRRGQHVAAQAGDGFVVAGEVGPHRARVAVIAATIDARLAEANDRALTSAIDAARD